MLTKKSDKNTLFDQIDDYFHSKSPSESSMIMGLIALGIAYGVYQFIFLETDKSLQDTTAKISSMRQKLNTEQTYLSTHSDVMLSKRKADVEVKYTEFDNTGYKMAYVDNSLTELSYLLFDDKSWANFVDKISFLAKKYNVKIEEIGNKFYTPTFQKITQVVEVDVKSKSTLKNIVKFLNAIEESQLVVDVTNIKMTRPNKNVEAKFKIAVWGMKYK